MHPPWRETTFLGACAMTTKWFDNKNCTFKILLSWRFPRKAAFWDDFPLCPYGPPPPPPQKRKFYFYWRLAVSEKTFAPPLKQLQKNPRVRKIRVRNSGAGNGCANFMDAWKKCAPSAGKTHVHKIPRFRGGGGILGFGAVPIYFYGRADFSESLAFSGTLFDSPKRSRPICMARSFGYDACTGLATLPACSLRGFGPLQRIGKNAGDPTWWVPFIQNFHFPQFYSK